VRNSTGITFVPSKACKDCGKRIFLNQPKREYCDDDGSSGFKRHNCPNWKPNNKPDNIIVDSINHLERQQIEILSQIAMFRKSLYDIGQAVFDIQQRVSK
jgi:hypothetical protein